jgi:DNA-binding CsgD family transcriptional regulator
MERRVNLLFILFAASVSVANSLLLLIRSSWDFASLIDIRVFFALFGTVLFLFLQNGRLNIVRMAHISFLSIVAIIAILDSVDAVYGLGFALLALYLAQKYGFFIRRTILKAIVSFIVLITVIEISALQAGISGSGIDILLFVFFFFAVFYFGDRETLLRYKEQEEALKERIRKEFGSGVDLKKMGFTEREIEVGAVLCQTLGTDKEIAYDLNISKNTVINHLRSMRDKADVRDRQHLIEAIRGYYISKDVESGD